MGLSNWELFTRAFENTRTDNSEVKLTALGTELEYIIEFDGVRFKK